jgi:hypothetical protein
MKCQAAEEKAKRLAVPAKTFADAEVETMQVMAKLTLFEP